MYAPEPLGNAYTLRVDVKFFQVTTPFNREAAVANNAAISRQLPQYAMTMHWLLTS
jgi:hypothetical protein